MSSIKIESADELSQVAKELLAEAGACRFFIFEGEMGAGKTTLIKAFCEALGVPDVVSSPTFSIVNEYKSPAGPVYHFDFYRLKNIQEAYDLGYEEYFYSGHYCLIEWPGKVAELLPENYVKIQIEASGGEKRTFTIERV